MLTQYKCLFFVLFSLLYTSEIKAQQLLIDPSRFSDSVDQTFIGKKFPEFSAKLTSGQNISSQDLKNKAVFINFWFAACTPCLKELKGLNRLFDSIKTKSSMLFLSFTFDSPEISREAVKRLGIRFPVINVSKDLCRTMGATGFPKSMVLSKNGIIKWISDILPVTEDSASAKIYNLGYTLIQKEL